MRKKLLYVAIDYEYAFLRRPEFIYFVIQTLKEHGHQPFFFTTRGYNQAIDMLAKNYAMASYYTEGQPASDWFKENCDHGVDIWVSGSIPSLYDQDFKHPDSPLFYDTSETSLHVGMDYDGTYNADPKAFHLITDYCLKRPKEIDVRIVTGRMGSLMSPRNSDILETSNNHNRKLKAIFTQLLAKENYLANVLYTDFKPDIWFDDEAEYIIRDR